jgi:hypothetical protein
MAICRAYNRVATDRQSATTWDLDLDGSAYVTSASSRIPEGQGFYGGYLH